MREIARAEDMCCAGAQSIAESARLHSPLRMACLLAESFNAVRDAVMDAIRHSHYDSISDSGECLATERASAFVALQH